VPLLENIGFTPGGAAQFGVAVRNGALAYVASNPFPLFSAPHTLVWVDRKGRETPLAAPPRGYVYARLSPDGTRVVLDVRDGETADIWIWDLSRETLTRLTVEPAPDRAPVWSPDGQRIAFSSGRDGSLGNLFWQAADGTGAAVRLAEWDRDMFPTSFSPDASQILM
jgi:serine/threonine-protein kinase